MGISFNNKKYAPFTGSTPTAKIYKGRTPIWDSSLFKILTQWKLVGNSEVIDGQIMSCGDLGEDGKYHVRIKADSRVIDIPLDEPLRKVGDVGDTIDCNISNYTVPSDGVYNLSVIAASKTRNSTNIFDGILKFGSIDSNGSENDAYVDRIKTANYIPVIVGETYYSQNDGVSVNKYYATYDENKVFKRRVLTSYVGITINEGEKYLRCMYYTGNESINDIGNVWISNNIETKYEPFGQLVDFVIIHSNGTTENIAIAVDKVRNIELKAGDVIALADADNTYCSAVSFGNGGITTFNTNIAKVTRVEGGISYISVPNIPLAKAYSSANQVPYSEFSYCVSEDNAYGIEYDKTSSNPDVTRIGNMELHKTLPIHSKMRGCLLNDNGDVVKYLNPDDWTNETLDGSQGQVMVEIPEFYWKFTEEGNIQRVMMSDKPIYGYSKVPKMYVSAYEATVDRTTNTLASVKSMDAKYRGGNNASSYDGTYRTMLGKAATAISLTNFRAYARKRKANSTEWNCNTYLTQKVLFWLFVVEYATRYSQKDVNTNLTSEGYKQGGLGAGVTTVSNANWTENFGGYPFIPIGHTDSLGNNSGEISYDSEGSDGTIWATVNVPRYRGIENPFGHLYKLTDGIHVMVQSDADGGQSKVYVSYDTATWNDSNYDGYEYIGDEPRSNSYIKEVLFGEGGDIMAKTNSGASTTYFTDYHTISIPTSGTALRGVRFGGGAVAGSYAGFGCSSSAAAPSISSASVGSRLVYIPKDVSPATET